MEQEKEGENSVTEATIVVAAFISFFVIIVLIAICLACYSSRNKPKVVPLIQFPKFSDSESSDIDAKPEDKKQA